ncbi:Hsp20/alpha crystallin family protein [Niabella drilacis]|uniref:HSP20 family protein n=1 Tax=Niabella drilacis (strain DSM 25811 / CCM 8410 / CCUG 62505 / LMG 26954 / E90) TaxID=1285928 RepID=A0A1G6IF85_NIADE|nr:Hsp20/alpha crystallin family protein [Niabella drilacis]SDC05134.1 HSP20 family protein [Niabella drilacis]
MTNVKFNGTPFERTLTSLVDDFITEIPTLFKPEVKNPAHKGFVPVNITEKENEYQIEVVAPGFDKSDFKINLDQQVLTISGDQNETTAATTDKTIRKEFRTRSFKRTFTVDDKVDTDKIEAKYVNGILIVTIQKKETTKTASKDIEVL